MNRLQRRNFTVIEMLAVMGIILILAGMLVAGAGYARNKARHSKGVAQLRVIELALSSYNDDWGFYPEVGGTADAVLDGAFWDSLKSPSGKFYINYQEAGFGMTFDDTVQPSPLPDPYKPTWNVGEAVTGVNDSYGQPWRYSVPGVRNQASFDLWSIGTDAINDSDQSDRANASSDDSDDIANWKRN